MSKKLNLNEQDLITRFKLGFFLVIKTFFEFKTLYYASMFIAVILFTYGLTMANVLYHLKYFEMARYYNWVAIIALSPTFIFNSFLLDDYLKQKNYFVLNKILNSSLFAFYGGIIILSAFIFNTTSVMHLKLLCCLNELIFIVAFISLLLKEINISFYIHNNKHLTNIFASKHIV